MRALRVRATALLMGLCLLIGVARAFYESSDVVELTESNFHNKVKKGFWLVEFYAPWCGHCKALKEDWKKAAAALKGVVRVGAVDADAFKDLAHKYNVKGFPTVAFFHTDASGSLRMGEEYAGARTAKDIIAWALKKAEAVILERIGEKPAAGAAAPEPARGAPPPAEDEGDFYTGTDVVVLTDADFESKVVNSDKDWVVEFYAPWCGFCKRLKPIYIDAAKAAKGKGNFAAVDCTLSAATCKKYGVNGYPTIKRFGAADKEKPEEYEGNRSLEDLVGFATGEKVEKKAPPPEEDFFAGTDVVVLTDADFDAKVVSSSDAWTVMFFAPWCGHCKNLKPTFIDAAKDAKGRAFLGAVDCTKSQATCSKYGVNGYPTMKKFGKDDKTNPLDYGGARTRDDIVGFATGEKVEKRDEFYEDTGVVGLNDDNFESEVLESDKTWLVKFYAPWCGHCKNLKETWTSLGTELEGKAFVGSVDCTRNQKTCSKFGINAYPTIKKFAPNKKPEEYEGDRTVADLASFASGQKKRDKAFYTDTDVVELTDADFESKVVEGEGTWVVKFFAPWCGHCKTLKPAFIAAATAAKGKATFGSVDCTKHKATCGKYEIEGYPTIKKFLGGDKEKPEEYAGNRSKEDLVAFATGKKAAKAAAAPEEDFYTGTDVVVLTDANFESKVVANDKDWVVEFYAPWCGFCKRLKPTYIAAAKAAKGKGNFGAVDCTQHAATCQKYGVDGYPTIKKFLGADKDKPEEYAGNRSLESLVEYATGEKVGKKEVTAEPKKDEFYAGTDVVSLTDDDFESKVLDSKEAWLVEFYAPWCGFCKRLKDTWISLATEVKGKVNVGAVDCTQQAATCSKLGVDSYPTVKKFGKTQPEEYSGDRSLADLKTFATGGQAMKDEL